MKNHYESPEVLVFSFKSEGVICTSDLLQTEEALQEMDVETFVW